MWEQLAECAAPANVAFCIPFPAFTLGQFTFGPTLAIYWYGILAALGIFVGTIYAARHVEWEGQNSDMVWDALLWVLIPALVGARVWYVVQAIMGGDQTFIEAPIQILNFRAGGLNIFGGAIFGAIALIVYAVRSKMYVWLLTDASLLGLLLGQGIGRIGNYINVELYGPPTGSDWFGMFVPADRRLSMYQNLTIYPLGTRFHPTMFYEAAWLFLTFGVLFYLFYRYQDRIVHGIMTGAYLIAAGVGRFFIEFFRPDQPKIADSAFSYSQVASLIYLAIGVIILLDRLGHFRIPWIARPQNARQRQQAYQAILVGRRKHARSQEREKERVQRKKQRTMSVKEKAATRKKEKEPVREEIEQESSEE
jgi:phosphatidylglycerol:prolipoprotein diacylglycerol transferase